MPDSIADAAVALSLMREALGLLDAPEHATVAAHLRQAINELSPEGQLGLAPSSGVEQPGETKGTAVRQSIAPGGCSRVD
jgi:hypothetical protein